MTMKTKHPRLSNNKKRLVRQLVVRASNALSAGQTDICKGVCVEIERIWPGNPDAANLRGIIHVRFGDISLAETSFLQAIKAAPRRPEFHRNLGAMYAGSGRFELAIEAYQTAWGLEPGDVGTALALGHAWVNTHQPEQAMQVLQQILQRNPHNPDILAAIADIHFHQNQYQEACNCLDAALKANQHHEQALIQKATLWRAQGQLAEAGEMARRILSINPVHAEAAVMLGGLKKFSHADDEDIRLLEHVYRSSSSDITARKNCAFALGKIMEDTGDYDQAFQYFHEGNEIVRRHAKYNPAADLEHFNHIIRCYSSTMLSHHSEIEDATPIFIVGLPRCGSTLVEQILAAHPNVTTRGEWQGFELLINELHTPEHPLTLERIAAFSTGQWQEIGHKFLTRIKSNRKGVDQPGHKIVDKTLENIRLMGAIHCALPHARIVHVRRHPMDACWSLYKSDLVSDEFNYAYSLQHIAHYYHAYLRLAEHWRKTLPEGVMYELDYEDLVRDQKEETGKLLAACNLPWDEGCLKFQQADNIIRTSSVAQVRQTLYGDAVQRWRHYETHLQPLLEILADDLKQWPPN